MELADILSGKEAEAPPAAPEVVAEPKAEPVETEAQKAQRVRDEAGRFAKDEVKAEPKQPELTEKERGFLAAAEAERKKRQDLERRLAEYEKKQPEQPAEKKSFWDDPEGHLKKDREETRQEVLHAKLQLTEQMAREKYKDFDPVIEVFAEQLHQTPGLHAQWLASPNPAEFAYKVGKHAKDLREAGSIDALRERIEKETRVKLEAEFKARQEELDKQRAALPGSLSDVRGGVAQNKTVFTGPPSLDDILAGK